MNRKTVGIKRPRLPKPDTVDAFLQSNPDISFQDVRDKINNAVFDDERAFFVSVYKTMAFETTKGVLAEDGLCWDAALNKMEPLLSWTKRF